MIERERHKWGIRRFYTPLPSDREFELSAEITSATKTQRPKITIKFNHRPQDMNGSEAIVLSAALRGILAEAKLEAQRMLTRLRARGKKPLKKRR